MARVPPRRKMGGTPDGLARHIPAVRRKSVLAVPVGGAADFGWPPKGRGDVGRNLAVAPRPAIVCASGSAPRGVAHQRRHRHTELSGRLAGGLEHLALVSRNTLLRVRGIQTQRCRSRCPSRSCRVQGGSVQRGAQRQLCHCRRTRSWRSQESAAWVSVRLQGFLWQGRVQSSQEAGSGGRREPRAAARARQKRQRWHRRAP